MLIRETNSCILYALHMKSRGKAMPGGLKIDCLTEKMKATHACGNAICQAFSFSAMKSGNFHVKKHLF